MSTLTIQEQFNEYLKLLNQMHNIDQDIDGLINEVEITDLQEKRSYYKKRFIRVSGDIVAALEDMGAKYPIHNYLANQTTYLYVENGKLLFEYH
ncbi:hypothetical protein [Pedobacter aquatilis]|uniref:hypothetical protein n=1 Tax=Pedobacter aquatilis TaxID=351343 RepID=UPI0029311CD6|nr:hypothetical protein [Pedobacter aquatilis]